MIDERKIAALAATIAKRDNAPLWLATERATIELYGGDAEGELEKPTNPPKSGLI